MKTLPYLKTIKTLHRLENLGAEIIFDPQEEDISPSDQFDNEKSVNYVINSYNNGNAAAWFCAKVTVQYKGLEADDYLGCCSYKSFKEFTNEPKGYYVDMINQCIAEINKDVIFANSQTQKFWNIRKAKNILKPYGLFVISSNQLQTL